MGVLLHTPPSTWPSPWMFLPNLRAENWRWSHQWFGRVLEQERMTGELKLGLFDFLETLLTIDKFLFTSTRASSFVFFHKKKVFLSSPIDFLIQAKLYENALWIVFHHRFLHTLFWKWIRPSHQNKHQAKFDGQEYGCSCDPGDWSCSKRFCSLFRWGSWLCSSRSRGWVLVRSQSIFRMD